MHLRPSRSGHDGTIRKGRGGWRHSPPHANGHEHIRGRRAASDAARARMFLEAGATQDVTNYPANFGNPTSCTLAGATTGQCEASPVRSWSPIEADTPFRTV